MMDAVFMKVFSLMQLEYLDFEVFSAMVTTREHELYITGILL
jgi:hypothetical protein